MIGSDYRGLRTAHHDEYRKKNSVLSLFRFYLCCYALAYPLIANFAIGDERGGSFLLQVFQMSIMVCLVLYLAFDYHKNRVLKLKYWFGVLVYLGVNVVLMLRVNKISLSSLSEWGYFAKIGVWLLWFYVLSHITMDRQYINRLVHCFWWGGLSQCLIAWGYYLSGRAVDYSVYSKAGVEASTGAAGVSGKAAVSFAILFMLLSFYWAYTRKNRTRYLLFCFLGLSVVAISYNRATQLALIMALAYFMSWLFFHRRLKQFLFLLAISILIITALIFSGALDTLMARWATIEDDEGSGRMTLFAVSANHFLHPDSALHFSFGCGVDGTIRLMERATGNAIGTHSDFFDMMLMLGLCGTLFYFLVWLGLLKTVIPLKKGSMERAFAACGAIFLFFAGNFTGAFQWTYTFCFYATMSFYFLAISDDKQNAAGTTTRSKRRKRRPIVHWDYENFREDDD